MPIIKSARKKMRTDIKKTKENRAFKEKMKKAIKKALKGKELSNAVSIIDKGYKKKILKKNTAARLKAKISKMHNKNK